MTITEQVEIDPALKVQGGDIRARGRRWHWLAVRHEDGYFVALHRLTWLGLGPCIARASGVPAERVAGVLTDLIGGTSK